MNSRYQAVMEGAAVWGSFFRHNPDKFAESYLHLRLKRFQKILLIMMFWSTTFVFIACRGIGKTYISAIYCVIRCILWPGTKVCIASGTRGQAINVLDKIMLELKPASPELCAEINEKECKINGTNAQIVFWNSSVIKVVTASDTARGNRCHVLLLDEFRLISKDTVDTVLRKFLTLRRMPRYEELTEEQRKEEYAKEKNLTIYLSSAYFKDSWSYQKCLDTWDAMVDQNKRQFVCGFPYQLSICEGLLDEEMIADDMQEQTFSAVKFSMEMEAMFYGSADGAFFDLDSISKNRKIRFPMLPGRIAERLNSPSQLKIPHKLNGEMRILSADIALMSSRRNFNDATAIFINQLLPTKAGRYTSNIVYADSCEGLRTDDQALMIRKLFDEYSCDYIVLDAAGVGIGVFDTLARDIVDHDTGEVYPALSCCNSQEMAARCTSPGAAKVIWAIKAGAQFNSDCAFLLREGFRSGRIRLLVNDYEAEQYLCELRGYNSLDPAEQVYFQLPYLHTNFLVDELINLQHEDSNGKIKIYEKSGYRKDRYSSLSYNYYVALQLENKNGRRMNRGNDTDSAFLIRAPKYSREAVSKEYDRYHASSRGRSEW